MCATFKPKFTIIFASLYREFFKVNLRKRSFFIIDYKCKKNKVKYNNSVHLIRNKNHQEKLKEDEMYIYFDLFDGPLQIQLLYLKRNIRRSKIIYISSSLNTFGDFYSLLSVLLLYLSFVYNNNLI